MVITQISAVQQTDYKEASIFGLGYDNQIYWWNIKTNEWELNGRAPREESR